MTQPWTDMALFFGTIFGIILIGCIIYALERLSGCWHKWGNWFEDSTDDNYVQLRRCTKCGYTEREVFKKVRS